MSKYTYTATNDNSWLVSIDRPLDIRTVQSYKTDLIDYSKFGSEDPYVDYRYQGMVVVVVDDTEDNNGIYWLKGKDPNVLSSWEKVGGNSDFHWPDAPEDYDANKRYYLDYNGGNPQWRVAVTKLSDLEDVANAASGQVLKFDGTNWVPHLNKIGLGRI